MSLDPTALLLKKMAQVFPGEDPPSILSILDQYGVLPYERERRRVQLAILKLSEGSLDRLRQSVADAKRDYRDVLSWAEYPNETRTSISDIQKMRPETVKRIRAADRAQYLEWLNSDA